MAYFTKNSEIILRGRQALLFFKFVSQCGKFQNSKLEMGQSEEAGAKFQFYNSETGEILGRTGASWLKILLFYIVYFSFLAGLFYGSLVLMKTQAGENKVS